MLAVVILNCLELFLVGLCSREARGFDLVGRVQLLLFDLLLTDEVDGVVAQEHCRLAPILFDSVCRFPVLAQVEQSPGELQSIRLITWPFEEDNIEVRAAPRQFIRRHLLLHAVIRSLVLGQQLPKPFGSFVKTVSDAVVHVEAYFPLNSGRVLRERDEAFWYGDLVI